MDAKYSTNKYTVGQRSGFLVITGFVQDRSRHRRPRTDAICTCEKCGKTDYLILPYNFSKQKSCGCDRVWASPPAGEKSKLFKGYKEMPSIFIYKARKRASAKKLPFDLTQKFLWELYEKQKRKCALSGWSIDFGSGGKARNGDVTASLDRIDSNKGYTKDNVQWLHKDINLMKNIFETDYFVSACNAVSATTVS